MHFETPQNLTIPTYKEYPCLSLDWNKDVCHYNLSLLSHIEFNCTEDTTVTKLNSKQYKVDIELSATEVSTPFHTPLELATPFRDGYHIQLDAIKLGITHLYITEKDTQQIQNMKMELKSHTIKDITEMEHQSHFKVITTYNNVILQLCLAVDKLDIRSDSEDNAFLIYEITSFPINSKGNIDVSEIENTCQEIAFDLIHTNNLNIDTILHESNSLQYSIKRDFKKQ